MLQNLGDPLNGEKSQVALIDLSEGEDVYTYAQLETQIEAQADVLGIDQKDRIGLLANNSAAFVSTFFAIMRRGGVAVPINTKFPRDTLAHITQDAELKFAFVEESENEQLPNDLDQRKLSLRQSTKSSTGLVTPEFGQPGLVLYTSGSTGMPKGVLLSHDSQWAMVDRLKLAMSGAIGIIAAPLYHMNGLLGLWSLFAGGGTVVLMPRFEARAYLQAVHDHRVNVITGVPTMLSLMLKEQDLLKSLDLSCVAGISVGSAPLSETLIEQVQDLFPNASIRNGYGTTEAGAMMFGAHPEGIPVPSLSLGYPQTHVEVRLVDGTNSDEGVLEIKTPAAMNGYLNLPEKTAEKMDAQGWITTGDIMRRDENGFFYFVGRDDDMFNCGGENIYPGEVERIMESDPRVAESCVVPIADEIKGQKPVAFVVTAVGHDLTEQAVKDVVLENAPAYMHPRQVYFLEEMPLAGTNKIDRKALTALAAEGAPTNG